MTTNTQISAGEIIVFTAGEYSDFGIEGYTVSRIDFDLAEALKAFREHYKGDKWREESAFIAWLISTERMIPVSHRAIHLGDYGGIEL